MNKTNAASMIPSKTLENGFDGSYKTITRTDVAEMNTAKNIKARMQSEKSMG